MPVGGFCLHLNLLCPAPLRPGVRCNLMPGLDDSVMDFVSGFTGVKRSRLTSTSTLLGDLGVDGADGWELLESFGKRFQVDLSQFQANRHFGPEDLPIYAPFLWLWWVVRWPFRRGQTPEDRAGLKPIRISDLIAAARDRRWAL